MNNRTKVSIENNSYKNIIPFRNLSEGDYFLYKGHLCIVVVDSETGIIRACDLQNSEIIDITLDTTLFNVMKKVKIIYE